MATKTDPKKTAKDLADATEKALATMVHARDRDAVRRAANDNSTWSMSTGADEGSADRYMKDIAKGAGFVQRMKMKDTADNEVEDQAARDSRKHKIPSYKKGGKIRKTGLAFMHKGEKVTPVKKSPRKKG